jgi:outer membrane protein TolC
MNFIMVAHIVVPLFFLAGMAISWAEEKNSLLSPLEILKLIEANGDHAFAAAGADISIAQAKLDQAKSALSPSLTFNTTGQVYQSTQKNIDNAEIYGALEVVKPIYDFGKRSLEINAASYDVEAAQQALITSRNMVLLEGLALLYNLHASELQLRAYNEIHASAYVRWARAKEQLGLARTGPIEVSRALMLVEKTRLNYFRERTRNNTYRMRLEELTNQTLPDELISPPPPPKKPPHEADREEFTEIVMQRNPEMLALLKQAKAKGLRRSAITSLPSVEAFGNVGHSSRVVPNRNEYAVGARMSWKVFDGGLKLAQRNRLAAEESLINAQMELMRRRLRQKSQVALMKRADFFQRVISARAELDYTQKNMLRRQQLYSLERVTDLGLAMVENSQAEAALIRATGAYQLESAGIAMLLGDHPAKGLEENYLFSIMGSTKISTEGYVPKTGSGFGQDDQNKINKNTE